MAFLNTDIAASFAAITWLIIETIKTGKPKFLGLLTGAVAGLATITPAAGFVSLPIAALIGILAGAISFLAVALKNKLGWDDALDVWGVHGVGGTIGVIFLGLFASKAINPAGANGLFYGDSSFFMKELVSVVAASVYAFIFTYIMLIVINLVTKVKVSEEEQKIGVDKALFDEDAYI